jgi:penicillin-binding protein 1A
MATARSTEWDLELTAAAARSRRRRRKHGPRRRLLRSAVALIAFGVVSVVLLAATLTPRVIEARCPVLRPQNLGANSFVTASDGSLLGAIPRTRNRQQLSLAQISPWLAKATIAVEDRRFWQHGPLDYLAIARAALADVRAGRPVEGASTLTQQLARNVYLGDAPDTTISRKLEEACLAIRIAQHMSKRRILAGYLNAVYYGNHAYGVAAAAQTYFSRRASQLSTVQAALIAGLPQAPTFYDPLNNPHAALVRRNEVLRAEFEAGYLKAAAWNWARRRPLVLQPGTLYTSIHQPNFFGYVERRLVARYGQRFAESGGLRVRTTIDLRLQDLAQRTMKSVIRSRSDPSGVLIAIDPRNGKVRAMAVYIPSGQRLQFNLATQGHRQTGSAAKPFTLATALEHGISLYATYNGPPELVIPDRRCLNGINQFWDVHNNADETAGTMNLIDATANSVNTIFAQLVSQVGPSSVVRMAHRLGIRSELKPVCSITLGTQAVSPLEMTSAYATFADRGVRHDPQAIESVQTAAGNVVPYARTKPHEALSQQISDEVTYALEAVTRVGTGTGAAIGRPIAGKTGTAERYIDAWFCGYVPQLAACVWVGYPGSEVPLGTVEGYYPVYGGTIPALIWHNFMTAALADVPVENFPTPSIAQPTYSSRETWTSSSTSTSPSTSTPP